MADFGYDVSDYCDVDPLFGDLAIRRAGRPTPTAWACGSSSTGSRTTPPTSTRGSSTPHRPGTAPHRDWYVWRDPEPDGTPPNNWVSAFDLTAPAWTFHEPTGQWYLHLFEVAQPDLNWDEPAVEAAMHDTLRFWLDRGSTGSGRTSSTASARTRRCPTTRPTWRGSRTATQRPGRHP